MDKDKHRRRRAERDVRYGEASSKEGTETPLCVGWERIGWQNSASSSAQKSTKGHLRRVLELGTFKRTVSVSNGNGKEVLRCSWSLNFFPRSLAVYIKSQERFQDGSALSTLSKSLNLLVPFFNCKIRRLQLDATQDPFRV